MVQGTLVDRHIRMSILSVSGEQLQLIFSCQHCVLNEGLLHV